MIRGIIFDCFGVLYGGSLHALIDLCAPERVQELRDLNKQSDYGYISGDEYIEQIAAIVGKSRHEIEDMLSQKHIRNQALVDFSQTLRPDYKIGLLSNVSSGTMDYLFPPEQRQELFDAVLLSFEENIAKPNPAIFVMMAERLGLRPDDCVMIDDLEQNCDGAEIAGMQSILHTSNETTIKSLRKLLQ